MLIKEPSRFKIRNADSHDCLQLYQLIKQCNFELNHLNEHNEFKKELNIKQKFNQIDLENSDTIGQMGRQLNGQFNSRLNNQLNNQLNIQLNNQLNGQLNNQLNSQSTLEQFEEFVDCLGFSKNGSKRKILDCILIEDLEERKIIALITYSYGYFSYNGKEIHLNHFYVKPEYRLNGFGRLLFLDLAKFAAEQNLHKIKYDALRTNEGFCKFMSKLGARSFTDDTNYCLFKMDLRIIKSKLIDLF